MRRFLITTAVIIFGSTPVFSQGVPVHDSANFLKHIEEIQQMLKDYDNQLEQLETLKKQLQNGLAQLTNLEGILGSVTGLNEIAELYNSAEDIVARSEKLTDVSGFVDAIALGDPQAILDAMVNMDDAEKARVAERVENALGSAGLSTEHLGALSGSDSPAAPGIANTAAANAAAMVASDIAYEEARASLARIDGLVEAIGQQNTLKESMDLNTRMTGEIAYMMGQMWRLNAASGLANGQSGVNLAAEMERQRAFFNFGGGE